MDRVRRLPADARPGARRHRAGPGALRKRGPGLPAHPGGRGGHHPHPVPPGDSPPQPLPAPFRPSHRPQAAARPGGAGALPPAEADPDPGRRGAARGRLRPLPHRDRGGRGRRGVESARRSRRHVAVDGLGVSRHRQVAGRGRARGAPAVPGNAPREERSRVVVDVLVLPLHGGRLHPRRRDLLLPGVRGPVRDGPAARPAVPDHPRPDLRPRRTRCGSSRPRGRPTSSGRCSR